MKASAGTSSGVRSGRGGESSTPAAATASPICIPAIETGRKKACARSPARASAAAIFRRSKARLHTTVRADAAPGPALVAGDRHPGGSGPARHPAAPGHPAAPAAERGRLPQRQAHADGGGHPVEPQRVPTAISVGLALVVAALTQWAEPWGLQQLNRVLNDVIKRNLQSRMEPGIFNDGLPRFMIYVASEDPAETSAFATWHGVLIEDEVGDGAPLLALAELGRIEDPGGQALALRLFRGELHRMEAKGETVARFQEGRFVIGVQDSVANKNKFARNEAALNWDDLRERVADLKARGQWREVARVRVEMVRRWAVPLICIAFAILGIPLAVATRGGRASAYVVTLGVFVGFYALTRFAVALAENGLTPWVAGFIPVAVVFALGGAFTYQLVRNGIGKPL